MADEIRVTPLGAGQDVGRSCILVSMCGKNIMLDCGMHMGYSDERRFPDFTYIAPKGESLTPHVDCVIISHFHLDHCGALPFMSEMTGYDGPIYMTHPTKAICPLLLEDMRKISADVKKEQGFFTQQMIKDAMKKVIAVNLHETVQVDDELEIKAYYAGHVLGAAMFYVKCGQSSFVYTGDYNMTPDRHLGAAWIDRCRPDLLITESTYATTIRDSKRCRERDFLKKIHETVDKGGKVLIPVFALGRAQELCILLESYWERMNLTAPIYFALGLTEKANNFYQMFITWTNQKIKNTFVERNMFEFKHIKAFDRSYADNPGPMVVFATPGMLHAGLSLQLFTKWCNNELNMIIMPGYCVSGTVGAKVLSGAKKIETEGGKFLDVKMGVEYMSFSAHADAKGIMQLIQYCEPKNVMLVHGEAGKMEFLKEKIRSEFNLPCFNPANGETCHIPVIHNIPAEISVGLLKKEAAEYYGKGGGAAAAEIAVSTAPATSSEATSTETPVKKQRLMHGTLVMCQGKLRILKTDEAMKELGLTEHSIRFTSSANVTAPGTLPQVSEAIYELIKSRIEEGDGSLQFLNDGSISVDSVLLKVTNVDVETAASPENVAAAAAAKKKIIVSWTYQDEDLGSFLLKLLKSHYQ